MTTPQDVRREYDDREGFDSGDRYVADGDDPDCPMCHGAGVVTDWVDYGSTRVPMETGCECVYADDPSDDGQPSDLQEHQDFAHDDDWASMPLGGWDE